MSIAHSGIFEISSFVILNKSSFKNALNFPRMERALPNAKGDCQNPAVSQSFISVSIREQRGGKVAVTGIG